MGKSPYEWVYNKSRSLIHLRVFGYLCFTTKVNIKDKFEEREEKCGFIGYSNVKKG